VIFKRDTESLLKFYEVIKLNWKDL